MEDNLIFKIRNDPQCKDEPKLKQMLLEAFEDSIQESRYIEVPQNLQENSGARNYAYLDRSIKSSIHGLLEILDKKQLIMGLCPNSQDPKYFCTTRYHDDDREQIYEGGSPLGPWGIRKHLDGNTV